MNFYKVDPLSETPAGFDSSSSRISSDVASDRWKALLSGREKMAGNVAQRHVTFVNKTT
jgi:hypothetical protein